MAHRILIVDDEQDIVVMLARYFTKKGYEVITAIDGVQALEKVKNKPDIILLDINMPKINGINVCKQIRDTVACPILFLTAAVDDGDKIKGFEAGGDDYIEKPFSIAELGARVAAHIRREHRPKETIRKSFLGDLEIDYLSKEVRYQDKIIPFVKKEFEIIELLSLNEGQVFDKERIYERLWGMDAEGNASIVAEHIRRIRIKFRDAECKSSYIETVWGYGYKWGK